MTITVSRSVEFTYWDLYMISFVCLDEMSNWICYVKYMRVALMHEHTR